MENDTKHDVAISNSSRTDVAEQRPLQKFSPFEEVERLFDRLMPRSWIRPTAWGWPTWSNLDESLGSIRVPQMDVIDREKEIVVRMEVPGVNKKDIDVSINENELVIKGSMSRETKDERKDYCRCEIMQGDFSRSLALPTGVETERIAANLKDGILEITLPKNESARRRSVEVK